MGSRARLAPLGLRAALGLLAALGGACGEAVPPAEALARAREAEARGEEAALGRWLEAAEASPGEEGRTATTWSLQRALAARNPAAALTRLRRIVGTHAGWGRDARGRELEASLLGEAIARVAVERAREAVEGPTPDPGAARAALAAGREALEVSEADDPEGAQALRLAEAYLALGEGAIGPRLEAAGLHGQAKPRILVVADHFEFLEPILPSVLRRWHASIPVSVAGRRVGALRVGMRRVAASPEEEETAWREAVAGLGLTLEGLLEADAGDALGLDPAGGAYVFVVGRDGRLAGRVSGHALDPRGLDDLVNRLAGR